MSRLRSAWARWVALTSRTETGETVAIFRILVGLGLVFTVTGAWSSGAWEFAWVPIEDGGYRTLKATWLVELLGGPSRALARALMVGSLATGAMLSLGIGGRATALVALQCYLPLTRLNTHTGGSYEHLLTNSLWLCVLAGCTATWSLDCRLGTGRWSSDKRVGSWQRWLIVLQLVLVYGSTGLQKMGSSWTPIGGFSAMYDALSDPMWARWELPWLGWFGPVLAVGTALVWCFEISWVFYPGWWWLRRTERPLTGRLGRMAAWARRWDLRPLLVGFGASMHLGIFVTMSVATFSWITVSLYVALWRPEEWRRFAGRVRGRRSETADRVW